MKQVQRLVQLNHISERNIVDDNVRVMVKKQKQFIILKKIETIKIKQLTYSSSLMIISRCRGNTRWRCMSVSRCTGFQENLDNAQNDDALLKCFQDNHVKTLFPDVKPYQKTLS